MSSARSRGALGRALALAVALLLAGFAGAAEPTTPSPSADPGVLRQEVDALRSLVDGRLPEAFEVGALFEVDLLDEAGVEARKGALKAEIADLEAKVRELSRPPTPPAKKAKRSRAAPQPAPAPSGPEVERVALRLERARLRLAFLSKALGERSALLEAGQRRQRIAEEQQAAARAQAAAEAAARRAEGARQLALEQAREAATAAAKELATERARAEAARALLAGLRADLAAKARRAADEAAGVLRKDAELERRATAPGLTTAGADALYDEVVALLVENRRRLGEAIDRLEAPSRAVPFSPALDPEQPRFQDLPGRVELVATVEALGAEAAAFEAEERDARRREASALVRAVEVANRLRIDLISRLSADKRGRVLGLTREGVAQLGRELNHVVLMARWYPRSRVEAWETLRGEVRDLFAVGRVSWAAVQVLALVGAALVARRRYRSWLQAIRRVVLARVRNRNLSLLVDRWLRFASAVAGDAGRLAFVYAFFHLLGAGTVAEVVVVRALVVGFAWYRLLSSAAHHAVSTAAGSRRASASADLSARILRSVRLVGRYGLAVYVLLVLSEQVLGRGYLYTIVVRFFWVGALPLALVLVQRWRADIASAYLSLYPSGRFARAVETTRDRPQGFFVAVAAFGSVAARGAVFYGQETMLRFDQTRRALAFLFRRRLEKQAETVGLGTADVTVLPDGLLDAFAEGPVPPELAVPHFPGMEGVRESLSRWRQGGAGAAVALVGERGIGKTSWLDELERQEGGGAAVRATLEERAITRDAVCRALGRALELGEPATVDELVAAAQGAPRRLVLLDHGQNLLLRAPDGLMGYEAFTEVVARTWGRLFWVCAFSKYAWEHLESVYRSRNLFRRVLRLEPWPEERIGDLIDHRMSEAGFRASYEDLVVDRVDGTEFMSEVIRTGERYRRLLWDYADGSPRVAVHFWLRSLLPDDGNAVRVRLFAAPSADELEALQEQSRFLLAAVVTHENLTLEEAARVLRYPRHLCEATLNYLEAQGFLDESGGRYRVTVHWNRAVLRFLRRKHLLFS